jgi:Cu/Ag efflux pump CusA
VVGGLLSATVLTLVILPAVYMLWKGTVVKHEIRQKFRAASKAA